MKTKTYYILLALAVLFCSIETADACSLNPTAVITTDPDGTVFYNGDPVLLSGENSTANCGSINQYRWRVRPVGGSYTTIYQGSSPTYNYTFPLLQDGESEKSYDIELRVRNSSGLFGYAYKSVTVKHSHDSYYYLTDHLGSVRVTVDERGDPVSWDDYYPFGLQMPGRSQQQYGSPLTDVKYTGYELNQEGGLGLYHAGARLYDPEVGRFMQQDRFKDKYPSMSPYQYAANSPIVFIDVHGDSIWVIHDEETNTKTIHYQGKLYNQSGKRINIKKATADIAEQIKSSFSGELEDGTVIDVNVDLTFAESMSDVKDSDHLIVLTDDLPRGRGWTPDYGHKVAYVKASLFTNPLTAILGLGPRTATHEAGHQMGLIHDGGLRNLMRSGGYGARLSNAQRIRAINFIDHGHANRGPNSIEIRLGQPPNPWPPPPRR